MTWLGLSNGELGLVLFIFGLVYSAALMPRLGAFVGRQLTRKSRPKASP